MSTSIATHYQPFLAEILDKIQTARYQILKTVSKEINDKVGQEKTGLKFNFSQND